MVKPLVILPILLISLSCNSTSQKEKTKDLVQEEPYTYDSLNIPDFFLRLFEDSYETYSSREHKPFVDFCVAYNIDSTEAENRKHYFLISFLHDLFTSESANDGSIKGALGIPYFWNWGDSNTRYNILLLPDSISLKEIAPPQGLDKYQNLADFDRVPSVYLLDLFTEEPKYFHPDVGSFYTFGWCSEREMAFSLLMRIYGYESKVVADGNHSWSDIPVRFKTTNSDTVLIVSVDNTFDNIYYDVPDSKTYANDRLERWYNSQVNSELEIKRFKLYIVKRKPFNRVKKFITKWMLE